MTGLPYRRPPKTLDRVFAWAVHLYTATGLLFAAAVAAVLLQADRSADDYRLCFFLMLLATLVDATDGTLARLARVKEVLPGFDGRRLDDLVDFLMYTCLPLLLIHRANVLPAGWDWLLLATLLASAYGFCQSDVKSADGSFVGFPSYWNIVAYYLLRLPADGGVAVVIIAVLAVLTFVPVHYPYPTQPGRINRLMLFLSIPWAGLVLADLSQTWDGVDGRWLAWASAAYPAAYLGYSWVRGTLVAVRRRF